MKNREHVLRREKRFFINNDFRYQPSDEETITINGRDRAPFWMNRRLVMIVGSSSCGLDLIGCPSAENNLDHYNNHDRRTRFIHLCE